jgi:hypothetical protein
MMEMLFAIAKRAEGLPLPSHADIDGLGGRSDRLQGRADVGRDANPLRHRQ